MIFRLNS